MLPTRRTQPFRADLPRIPGMALQAMLRGRQPGMVNGADFNRQRLAGAQGDLQALVQQRLRPRASADVRGQFAPRHPLGHWQGQQLDLQQLLLAALAGPTRVV